MKSVNIIFIDDEPEILAAYENMFKKKKTLGKLDKFAKVKKEKVANKSSKLWDSFDCKIQFASNGLEGVAKVEKSLEEKSPFQIAFIDMRMPPGINGAETAKRIRELDSNIEIVLITAYSDLNLDEINENVGRPDKLIYFKKPFYNEEIRQIIMNLSSKYENERIKESFISNVSHELRTPLASISGFASFLKSSDNLTADQEEYVSIIKDNSVLMEQLVDELLTSVQMMNGKFKIELIKQNPVPIIESAAKSMIPLFQNIKEVDFEVDLEKVELNVMLDATKIRQAILNILTNAMKFTKKGKVRIHCFSENGDFYLKVSDTGIGIPQDKVKLIFDRFSRIEDNHHSIPGLGLGLSIVKEIVYHHNADIMVESELGKGSTFTMRFKGIA